MGKSDKNEKLLRVEKIYKSFGSNVVLRGIDMELKSGEVLALIGGNGAGKSTLMKIIMGIYQCDKGNIYVNDKLLHLSNASAALAAGIYMVPQEPMLFPNMTVEENISMGFKGKQSELRKKIVELMKSIGWELDLERSASSLSIAEQTLVEIIRGLLREARILILDEPTSALTFDEVESFFKVVKDLREKGIGIIYITHRLAEVFEIATHVSIMCDGVITLNGPVSEFNRDMLIQGLLPSSGEQKERVEIERKPIDYEKLNPVFELKDYCGYGFNNISLKVYPGEILGLAGVVGAGRTELVRTIFGRDKTLCGKVKLDGKDITGMKTNSVLKAGINLVPEDRHNHGLFKISAVSENITASMLDGKEMGKFILNKAKEQELTSKYVRDFRIKVTDNMQMAGSLSGGNQQKVVIGKSLSTLPKLVILDEPTRGIDAAARMDVYRIIYQLRSQGVAILLISSDLEEIVELADRSISVFNGRINAEFSKQETIMDNLTAASFGIHKEKEAVQ
ncbi:MAG: sugar ABC transporter ATP-binding protein [Eubacteriales bacterium]